MHVVEEHAELSELKSAVLQVISEASAVLLGGDGERLAVREIEAGKMLVVVYRELSPTDGFVITAFVTRRVKQLFRRSQVWPPQN